MDLKTFYDHIKSVDLIPKRFESRKNFFIRVEKEYKQLFEYLPQVDFSKEDELESINVSNYLDGIGNNINYRKIHGQCCECLKYTSTYKGASYSSYTDYGYTEEELICPKCEAKRRVIEKILKV